MWYYAKGEQRLGPVTLDELRARCQRGDVQPADLVWTEGMADWEYAQQRPELAGSFPQSHAPNLTGMPATAPLGYGGYASERGYCGPANPAALAASSSADDLRLIPPSNNAAAAR